MTPPTMPDAWFNEAISELTGVLSDGFQLADLALLVGRAMEITERLRSMDGGAKKVLCIGLLNRLIDETDCPWLPDALADPLCKAFLPGIVDALAGASRGELRINERRPA